MGGSRETPSWDVRLSAAAVKQKARLPQGITAIFARLLNDLEKGGPTQASWANFGSLKKDRRIPENAYHCHLKKGRPTYVACWKMINKKIRVMEIFYVGTHESAPYK